MEICCVGGVDADQVRDVVAAYPGTRIIEANGDLFAIYDPDGDYETRPRQGWATIVHSDVNDTASNLDRPGVFRLNIGLSKAEFDGVGADEGHDEGHDPTAFDVVMPHPVYGAYHWVCVLNPDRSWPGVLRLLDGAHAFAARQHRNRHRRHEHG